jgi:hypothetical protein
MTAQFPTSKILADELHFQDQNSISIKWASIDLTTPANQSGPLIDINTYTSLPPVNNPFHSHSNVCASPLVISDPVLIDSTPVVVDARKMVGKKTNSDAPLILCREDLNWCDWNEVQKFNRYLDVDVRLLNQAQRKRLEYPDGFNNGNYFDNLLPIICSGYTRAEKIVCCGNTNLGIYKVPCDQWSLCSKCAYVAGIRASEMYQGTYNKSAFYHITLGFDGDVPFGASISQVPRAYWKENEEALKHLLDHDLIEGVYMSHELKVRSLIPLRVNPHSHAIVTAKDFPPELQKTLSEMIAGEPGIALVPSIEVKLIDTPQYHDKCIRYLTKAIELKEPYDSAWHQHCATDRKAARDINFSMREFLDAQAAAFNHFDRVVRFGNLMPQRKDFIGVSKAVREAKRKEREKPNPLKERARRA